MNATLDELKRIQSRFGYLPAEELKLLSQRIDEPLHRLHEVASFFPHLYLEPPSGLEVRVCRDMACHLRGSRELTKRMETLAGRTGSVLIGGASCLGRCDRAPAMQVSRRGENHEETTEYYLGRSPEAMMRVLDAGLQGALPAGDSDADGTDPSKQWMIDVYHGNPSYAMVRMLAKALVAGKEHAFHARKRALGQIEHASLLGMGGAGGRVYKKWREVLETDGEQKFVVCNADESEPGTFKDRELLLRTPHLTLEGMIVAGLIIGARQGYIYIRHEYHEQIERLEEAIKYTESIGASGENIFDSGLSFSLEVFVSPGGYICGEQTALIEAMEGKRAEPRNRPPELQTNGLWDCPTLLNNVETFAWVPAIMHDDGDVWCFDGEFRGRRMFSVSGDVAVPGVYEVPNGITLGMLIERAGGMRGGKAFKAVAPSGPSGGFLPRMLPIALLNRRYLAEVGLAEGSTHFDLLNWQLDIDKTRKMGNEFDIMLGGGIVIYAEGVNMLLEARAASEFYRNESCGKCVPCRIGSQRLVEIYEDLEVGRMNVKQLYDENDGSRGHSIGELADVMNETAICGLGKIAANPLTTLRRFFRADIEEYMKGIGRG